MFNGVFGVKPPSNTNFKIKNGLGIHKLYAYIKTSSKLSLFCLVSSNVGYISTHPLIHTEIQVKTTFSGLEDLNTSFYTENSK